MAFIVASVAGAAAGRAAVITIGKAIQATNFVFILIFGSIFIRSALQQDYFASALDASADGIVSETMTLFLFSSTKPRKLGLTIGDFAERIDNG
jgi:hypothetical protein